MTIIMPFLVSTTIIEAWRGSKSAIAVESQLRIHILLSYFNGVCADSARTRPLCTSYLYKTRV
jgi:hypothetical protein